MKIAFTLVALAVACNAAPAPAPNKPLAGLAQFFYDEHCNIFAKQLSINPKVGFDQDRVFGGPYGAKSAMFATTGTLTSWAILTGNFLNPTVKANKPQVGECVSSNQGVYVRGNNMITINTKGH